jgi:t-SNARE complex subunit (syntaxin)
MEKIDVLSRSAASIKKTSMSIKNMMVDDEALVADIDRGLVKNQNKLKQTMTKIDQVLTSASNNVLCYTLMFFIMILALLYKMTK